MADRSSVRWPTATGGDRLRIFELARPSVNERVLREQARALGLEAGGRAGRIESDEAKLSLVLGPHQVTVYRASGALRYKDAARWQLDDGESNLRFSDREGIEIAQRFVAERRLLSSDEKPSVRVTRLNVASSDLKGENAEQRVIDLGVVFERVIDGVPVDGPGGKLVVYIDALKQVTGVDRTWRQISGELKRVESLRPAAEVQERILSRAGRSMRAELTEVRLGYFEQGPQTRQRHLQPAYVVMLSLGSVERGPLTRTVPVEPAATNDVGSLMPRLRRPIAQQARSADGASR